MFIYDSIFNFLGCAGKKIAPYSLEIPIEVQRETKLLQRLRLRQSSQGSPIPAISGTRLFAFVFTTLALGQAFQFLLVDFDLARLFHLLTQITDEQTKQFLLFALAQ